MKLVREISLGFALVQFYDANLIRVKISGSGKIDYGKARAINDAIGSLTSGRRALILMVADKIATFSKEGLAFSAGEEGQRYTIADALVVKSFGQMLTANVYRFIFRPTKPTRIFNSESAAIKWLFAL